MTDETVYIANPDVMNCDIGGERALLHLKTNTYFTLNSTASILWPALSEPLTVDQMVETVTEHFDVSAERCRPDIEALIGQMVAAQVLQPVPAEASA